MLPLAQVIGNGRFLAAPDCRTGQLLLIGKAEVDDLIDAIANDGDLAGHDGLYAHPLLTAGNAVVQAGIVCDLLLCRPLCRSHAAVHLFAGQAVHKLVCSGDIIGVDERRLIAQGLIPGRSQHLAALARMNESGHAAVALHQIKVDSLGREGSNIREECVTEKGEHRRRKAHDLGEVSRGVNIHFIRHNWLSSFPYFRKMPMLRKATSSLSAVTPFSRARRLAKNSPVR